MSSVETAWKTYEPCPHCEGRDFVQSVSQNERVAIDEDGNVDDIVPDGSTYEVEEVWCTGCDTQLLGDGE